tara:strand:+ start:415 stop:756 length:342 start_codon:yes stop_codon:yes gene_type:complete
MDPSSVPGVLPDSTITPPLPTFSISSYFTNLPFSLKVLTFSLIMLFFHYSYIFIKNKFFSKKVSFDEDSELIEQANIIDDDESITDSVKFQMENDLKHALNDEQSIPDEVTKE